MLFFYKQALDIDLPWLDDITSAKPSQHLPTVLTSGEARALLHELSGTMWQVAKLPRARGRNGDTIFMRLPYSAPCGHRQARDAVYDYIRVLRALHAA